MNPIELINLHKDTFTKTETKIMNYVLDNLEEVMKHSIISVAESIDISKSALLRFCQKLGYSGYSEFKYDISRFLYHGASQTNEIASPPVKILDLMMNTLETMKTFSYNEILEKLSNDIIKAPKIKIFGLHESGLSAKQLQFRLTSIGIDAESVTDTSTMSDKALLGKKGDVAIFFSLSAMTPSINDAIDESLNNFVTTVLITQNSLPSVRSTIDHLIPVPTFKVDDEKKYLDPQLLNYITIELIIDNLAKAMSNLNK